jgi:hypothetical protein
MHGIARFLILAGVILVVLGFILLLFPKIGALRMPGDIVIKRENVVLYFPIVTSVVLSLIITLVLNIILRR